MYTQFFGNYLLNKHLITLEQLMEAIQNKNTIHMKLGVLAIHNGYMTANDVERVRIKQTQKDKRFGEIAVEEGFLTHSQVNDLLNAQTPDYLLLSQLLVDKGYLTMEQFQTAMVEYQSLYELTDLDFSHEQNKKVNALIREFYEFDELEDDNLREMLYCYITLLFNSIIRFVGDDFTPYPIVKIGAYPITWCVSQKITGEFSLHTALDMDESTLIAFASRYVGERFTSNNEYVKSSMEDFINLNNGLFAVNISNNYSKALSLQPPLTENDVLFVPQAPLYYIPIHFTFGTVNVMFVI
ncbi:chemotaxis protein CheX [Konateibacter massiliensis]|uniref:chemotaxis protein CheX n=1 Tax=Konateibacter massiliensis TaxID=2002841 RepID=UPI000C15C695|nr:chemotaxis protein CheX [Konateibacter massiliensis]